MMIIIIIILPVTWYMTSQKITYRIWSAYKHGALFHSEFKLQGKEILKTVFLWYMNVQPTHEGVLCTFVEHFLSHLCFHNIGISVLCNKNSELLIVPPVNVGFTSKQLSGLSFHTEITWEVDSVLLRMFFTLITTDTVCYVFLKYSG